ncbi:hypothetical protein [Brevibacillus borstelensis]|uniref:hypothetical protein n=1 Tax=Brevibacillus borstelensis TaxID=45462 RepID=UPI001D0B24E9|nr:hypothetical protein [Brevibacillus borstelensis]MCC0566271.1 hypothetical protein [Brevibacillus borstelensis]
MEMDQMATLLRTIVSEELKPIRDDISELKSDMDGLKSDVDGLKQDVSTMNERLKRVEETVSRVEASQTEEVAGMLKLLDRKLDVIRKDVEFTFMKVAKNELEINRLKK